jgi:hypothetical protein
VALLLRQVEVLPVDALQQRLDAALQAQGFVVGEHQGVQISHLEVEG